MTPKLALLFLALTVSLAGYGRCQTESSGDTETETSVNENLTVASQPENVTNVRKSEAQVLISTSTTVRTSSVTPLTKKPNRTTAVSRNVTKLTAATTNETNGGAELFDKNSRLRNLAEEAQENESAPTESTEPGEEDDSSIFVIIAVSLGLLLVITFMVVVGILVRRRMRRKNMAERVKEDPYLDAGVGEKVPMPMFEDDVPSVMELEMEDLEKWMVKADGGVGVDSKQKHFL